MNSYKFILKYSNNTDARDGAQKLKQFLISQQAPVASSTVAYNKDNSTVTFNLDGNVSAAHLTGTLTASNVDFAVTPIGDSQPLPMIYITV